MLYIDYTYILYVDYIYVVENFSAAKLIAMFYIVFVYNIFSHK